MRLTSERSTLLHGVQMVARAVSSRTTLPILGNIALRAQEGRLELAATDLDIWMECSMPVMVEKEGALTVPARVFLEILNALPEEPVELYADEGSRLHLTCGRSRYEIHGLPAEEYPHLPEVDGALQVALKQALLRELIRMTAFAASRDETRAILMGALLVLEPHRVRMVATDTYRLALRTEPEELPLEQGVQVVIPGRALGELPRLLKEEGEVVITIGENQIRFDTGEARLTSRLLEGQFPNFERVLPTGYEHRWRLPSSLFREAIQRCDIVARDDNHRILLTAEGDSLRLEAHSDRIGSVQEEMTLEMEGGPLKVAFNATYLLDALKVIEAEELLFDLLGPTQPGAIRPLEGPDFVYVLMPMQF